MNNLEDIKTRLAAATPGPWKAWDRGIGYEVHGQHDEPINDNFRETFTKHDADFIAHAPEDIARLVKALEAVQEQLLWAEACKTQWTSADSLRAKITEALDS